MKSIYFALVTSLLLLASCSRVINTNQGYDVDLDLLNSMEGKTAQEVKTTLGPPQSRWNIDGELWVYYFKRESNPPLDISAEIHFDEKFVVKEIIVVDQSTTIESNS